MSDPDPVLMQWLEWGSVAARAAAFAAIAPTFGISATFRQRFILAAVLTLMLAPMSVGENASPDWVIRILGELATGLFLGFALRLLWVGVSIAGQLVAQQLGIPFIAESEDVSDPAIGKLYDLAAWSIFVTCGGVSTVVAGLLDMPRLLDTHSLELEPLVAVLMQSFGLALRIAVPVVVAMITTQLGLGMMHRLLPGFSGVAAAPLQVAFGLIMSLLAIGSLHPAIQESLMGRP